MNNHIQANKLIEMICEEYGITMKDLKKKKSGFPNRSVSRKGKDVSLASIRQALSYFIFMHFPLRIKEVASMVGYSDHSPLSSQRKCRGNAIGIHRPRRHRTFRKANRRGYHGQPLLEVCGPRGAR